MKSIEDASAEVFHLTGGVYIIIIVKPIQNEFEKILYEPVWPNVQGTCEKILTLEDIKVQVEQQYGESLITVIAEYPLRGNVYRYGNYKDGRWSEIGTVSGYA